MLDRRDVTGLVLAGGRGSRMGGVDKGLQPWGAGSLASNALERLRPQVGPLMISANRHLVDYAALSVPVWPDLVDIGNQSAGPLAGILAGLRQATTAWLAVVPCDAPLFPLDLVERLADGLDPRDAGALTPAPSRGREKESPAAAVVAILEDEVWRRQPVFCLLHAGLADSLEAFLASGGRKAGQWMMQQGCIQVPFDNARAFTNLNTADELRRAAGG